MKVPGQAVRRLVSGAEDRGDYATAIGLLLQSRADGYAGCDAADLFVARLVGVGKKAFDVYRALRVRP